MGGGGGAWGHFCDGCVAGMSKKKTYSYNGQTEKNIPIHIIWSYEVKL